MRSAPRSIQIVLLALFTLLSAVQAEGAGAKLPRYSLPLGRKLIYSWTMQEKEAGRNSTFKGTWQFTVVGENPDGSSRVIVRSARSEDADKGGVAPPDRVTFAYADIFPDGRIAPNPTLTMQIDPSEVLPLLPADAGQIASGWTYNDDMRLKAMAYSAHPAVGKETVAKDFTFAGSDSGLMSKIYVCTDSNTFHFDLDKGIVSRIESVNSQSYGFQSTGTGESNLTSDEVIPADEAREIGREFDAMFSAKGAYEKKMSAAGTAPVDQAPAIMGQAKDDLAAAAGQARLLEVKAEYEKMLSSHEQYAKEVADETSERNGVVGKPAFDFSTTDIDGKPVKLSDYRGKVVVLDFWYRGCGWCMFAMPQIKQVAGDFKYRPLAVLGMNTDSDKKDARFVMDAQQLNYPTLSAAGIPEKYGIHGFPTLIVIDQQGIVREFDVGYTPTLRADLGKAIQTLLDKTPGGKVP